MDRVQKIIANAGRCSRRDAEKLIADGRVKVNGEVITLGDKATDDDDILIDDRPLKEDDPMTIAYYKPTGVQTTLHDEHTHSLAPLLREVGQRLIPAGRLDMDAEGLLILTNDGDLANYIMHPRYEKHKVYRARMNRPITDEHVGRLRAGVDLQDGHVHVHLAEQVSPNVIRVSVHEGRNKIIKRTLRKVTNGFVEQLIREKVGGVDVGDLQPGEWRELTKEEIAKLRE
jgi:23S rRNA pseudouridine2605 synthase